MTVWILPLLLIVVTTALAVPLAYYIAHIMDGKYKAPVWLHWLESLVNTGPQNWKVYTASLLLWNTLMFVFGYLVLSLQPYLPLNSNLGPNAHEPLAPTTIFNTTISFLTNTNLQDYSGEVHLSYFSQISSSSGTCSCRPRSASAP